MNYIDFICEKKFVCFFLVKCNPADCLN